MITVYNNIIPFKGYSALTIWPILFIRKDEKATAKLLRHELTHAYQQREMFFVAAGFMAVSLVLGCGWWSLLWLPLFYWWYLMEWIVRLCIYGNARTAYKNIAFEREAKKNENNINYNKERCSFAWVGYITGDK